MCRSTVSRVLIAYLAVVWVAMLVRVDRFPLTWAPMYSTYRPEDTISVRVRDRARMARGLRVTHRNGEVGYVSQDDLNLPKWNFWRLYYQRMFGKGPNTFKQGNMSLGRVNRWLRGLEPGEPRFSAEWDWRILRSLNATLGYEPADPGFIVRVEAELTRKIYTKADLSPSVAAPRSTSLERYASLEWKEAWRERWDRDDR